MSTVTGNPNRRVFNYLPDAATGSILSSDNSISYLGGLIAVDSTKAAAAVLTDGRTYYTTPIDTVGTDGVFSIMIKHTAVSGNPTITLGYQCGSTYEGWATNDFSGTSGLVIASALAAGTLRLDSFTAPYWGQMRFSLLIGGSANATNLQFIVTWK